MWRLAPFLHETIAEDPSVLSSELVTSLPRQRPKRADAARNYDKLLAAARDAFTSQGEDASLEAGYVEEVEGICAAAQEFEGQEPWQALTGWLRRFAEYATTKKALASEL